MRDEIQKNILDLHFQKNLVIASTTILVAVTYTIAVGVAFVTRQIKSDDFVSLSILFITSVAILGLCSLFFFKALFHIKNIPEILKNLQRN